MRPLQASELLRVWDAGFDQDSARRALALLAAACPDTPREELARLSIGRRDGRLLTLREWTFGSQVTGLAECPRCRERLELDFSVNDARMQTDEPEEPASLTHNQYEVRFRVPNSADLTAVSDCANAESFRASLLERCVLRVERRGDQHAVDQLPAETVQAVAARMAEADPQADVQLALKCPACAHEWTTPFDIVSYFWNEIEAWAERLLHDVHTLATAYGWREDDILSLTPTRRQFYLDMVRG